MVRDDQRNNDLPDRSAEAIPPMASQDDRSHLSTPPGDATRILERIEAGDPAAAEELLPLVYDALRRLAAAQMARERPGQTLQATALVHEAYLRLVDTEKAQCWNSRGHFFAAAAEAMRRILVEQARRKAGPEAGGGRCRVDFSRVEPQWNDPRLDAIVLSDTLDQLAGKAPRKAELVKLRFFAGLTIEQAAAVLGISVRTAYDDWAYAKCWLRVEMSNH
jgi:RNA polymerase sigma factor (TIGR02999 family)